MEAPFRHEALFYAGPDEFLRGTLRFIRDAIAADEPTLVVLVAEKVAALRSALGDDAGAVMFADMADVGANPARIIPAWVDFVSEHGGGGRRAVRGIGEPIYPERRGAELTECHRHEALLNVAFADTPAFYLMCPYDTEALDAGVVEEARRNHPHLADVAGADRHSDDYRGLAEISLPHADPLPPPPRDAEEIEFGAPHLGDVRRRLRRHAARAALPAQRVHDLAVAASEIAANSIRHGGGRGRMLLWDDGETFFCEVGDRGRVADPLVGRRRPTGHREGGYGVWMANQLCDLVQVRTFITGTVVRLHMRISRTAAGADAAPARPSRAGSTS